MEQYPFSIGREYSHREVREHFGGNPNVFLPIVQRRVVCACLRLDFNPKAPEMILVGTGPRIRQAGQLLCGQGSPVPVFLKRGVNRWEYRGMWQVQRWLDLPGDILREGECMPAGSVSRVVLMEHTGN